MPALRPGAASLHSKSPPMWSADLRCAVVRHALVALVPKHGRHIHHVRVRSLLAADSTAATRKDECY